jgi:hypothetical protein
LEEGADYGEDYYGEDGNDDAIGDKLAGDPSGD